MITSVASTQSVGDFANVQSQLVLEKELQQFFKITPPLKIENEFGKINGAVSNQFTYLKLALKVIEELDVEPVQAFGLLEAIRPIIHEKVDIITSHFFGRTVVSNSKAYDVLFDAIDLFSRLTATYDSVIEEARYFGESQAFIMGSAIHRALSDKARLVLYYLQLYQEVPASVWRHVNWLYRTADEFNIFNQVMADKLAFEKHTISVRQLYLYIMLLASAGARNINSEEIASLGELLKDWIKQVSIRKLDNKSNQCVLCMDPLNLSTPVFSTQLEDLSSKTLFYFDLYKLSEKLQRPHLHQKFVHNVRYTLSPWTADKINTNWTTFVERGQLRYSDELPVEVNTYVGLSMTWLISPMASVVSGAVTLSDRDYRDKKMDLNPSPEIMPFENIIPGSWDKILPIKTRVIDYSNTGYCLQWNDISSAQLAIDEILIIDDTQMQSQRLGQIVWIKAVARNAYQTGIAIISAEIIPVLARAVPSAYGKSVEKTSRGFIICHTLGEKKYFGVLLEQADWRTGTVVQLLQNEQPINVRLLEPLNQSIRYQSFNIAFFRE